MSWKRNFPWTVATGALKEPLIHFLVLGLLIFVAYHLLSPASLDRENRIVVNEAKVDQLVRLFSKTWQRPPTPTELKGLIDDYVKEEVYYREALILGLDKNDTLIRRHMRNKMQFLSAAEAGAPAPTDKELEDYLKANAAKYEVEPRISFSQIYFNPERRGSGVDSDVAAALAGLKFDPNAEPQAFGESTLLPGHVDLAGRSSIAQTFGTEFADAIQQVTPGSWTGPIKSGFGSHLVFVEQHEAGRAASLDDVRAAVTRDWADANQKAFDEKRFFDLIGKYDVMIELRREPQPNSADAQ